jgi:hypothetical protein
MPLAIATETGQFHEHRGRQLLEAFARHTHSELVVTDPTSTAALDALFTRDGVVVAVAEAKTRVSYDYPAIERLGSYLVTADKLETLTRVGTALAVPAFLVTELSDGVRLYWHLTNKHGLRQLHWLEAPSRTLSTSIGAETVVRMNAFLPIEDATIWGTGE